ncbi:MAG TPA: ABC transporter substrate-binding protein, partial [Bdellovibrionales bacterium]|nr:ABC transporter substrate-binding protein [Bdellovibrionales bacterium]
MRLTKRSYLTLAIILSLLALLHQPQAVAASQTETFRYHMTDEPHSLDPARNSVSDAAYFFPQLMRGLYTYSNAKGLVPEGAKRCSVQGLKISCELASKKWSDGSAVVADDYVRAFRHLLGKDSKNSALQLLSNLKNAIDVSSGKKPAADLGVASQGANKLVFTLQEPDPDFLFKLTSPLFVPIKSEKFPERDKASEIITNGPYKISEWSRGRRIRLVPDPQFDADA